LDKFKRVNIVRFLQYREKMDLLTDHTQWCFLDVKHIVNKDAILPKGRADPLTGYVDYIPVTGDFRDSYNIFAIISGNPRKPVRCSTISTRRTVLQKHSCVSSGH
jgi:hypothetical protein